MRSIIALADKQSEQCGVLIPGGVDNFNNTYDHAQNNSSTFRPPFDNAIIFRNNRNGSLLACVFCEKHATEIEAQKDTTFDGPDGIKIWTRIPVIYISYDHVLSELKSDGANC